MEKGFFNFTIIALPFLITIELLDFGCYSSFASSPPEDARALHYNNEGVRLMNAGKSQQAVESFSKAIALAPQDDIFYVNRGLAKEKLRLLKGAFSDFSKALTINDSNPLARFDRARVAQLLHSFQIAIDDYTHLMNATSDKSEVAKILRQRAAIKRAKSDYKGAAADLQRAQKILKAS